MNGFDLNENYTAHPGAPRTRPSPPSILKKSKVRVKWTAQMDGCAAHPVRGAEVNSEQRVGGCCGRVTSRTRKKLVCGLDFLIRRKGFPGATSGDEFTSTRRSILTAEREQSNYREPGRSGGSEGRAPGSVGGSTGSKDPKNELL
ncbi:hypothetical protein ACLB2K_058987 [Fragaria x ananassa]